MRSIIRRRSLGAVNTIVNTDGYLHAYNTDVIAVASLLKSHAVDPKLPFLLRGSGGMAAAVAGAFYDAGFRAALLSPVMRLRARRLHAGTGMRGLLNPAILLPQ